MRPNKPWFASLLSAALAVLALAGAQDVGPAPFTDFGLELVAEGLPSPHYLVSPPGDARMFVLDQTGLIYVIEGGELLAEPFLDVSEKLVPLRSTYDERGLLGLAFHPGYAENGRFFVVYSAPPRSTVPELWDHTSNLSEFRVSADPNRADHASERLVMQIDQPQQNHNGGALAFGPDGYLYYAVGDGGSADDTGIGHPPLGNGQDVTTILGSILRIDVDGEEPYAIPPDNPFVGLALPDEHPFSGDALVEEIWAWGFRHPWKMSLDPETGVFYVSDAGENLWEEVNVVAGPGNYGWNIKEGTHWFDPDGAAYVLEEGPATGYLGEPLIDPVVEYMNSRGREGGVGMVVIGGYLYRGQAVPELQGQYVFGDWSRYFDAPRGVLMVAAPRGEGELWQVAEVMVFDDGTIQGFGTDSAGETYVLVNGSHGPAGFDGRVYRIVSAGEGD